MADRTRARRSTTHACPGSCGVQVPQHRLACRLCWYLLPTGQRELIGRLYETDRVAHLGAVGDALIWYRDNVADGELLADGGDGRG